MAIDSIYETLQEIREAVIVDSKAGSINKEDLKTRVDRFINQGYERLIVARKREFLDADAFYVLDPETSGSCSVTKGSTTVTFDSSTSLSETTGYLYKFFAGGTDETYSITSFGTSTITLSSPYTGETNSSTTGKIVQYGLTLSEDTKTVYRIKHDKARYSIDSRGRHTYDTRVTQAPQRTGFAETWTTSGSDSSAAAYLLFYPYASKSYTLNAQISEYFTKLSDDTDQPKIPTEYRQLLYWYALKRVHATITRNADLYKEADQEFKELLAIMDSEMKPAQDEPSLQYDKNINFMRQYRRFRNSNRYTPDDA